MKGYGTQQTFARAHARTHTRTYIDQLMYYIIHCVYLCCTYVMKYDKDTINYAKKLGLQL